MVVQGAENTKVKEEGTATPIFLYFLTRAYCAFETAFGRGKWSLGPQGAHLDCFKKLCM